jgi:hypothetical protein
MTFAVPHEIGTSTFPMLVSAGAETPYRTNLWVKRIPGVAVTSAKFKNDSARHFMIPKERMDRAVEWVKSL